MLNRRSFLKACGVGVVAPSLVALGGTTAVPTAEVVEVFNKADFTHIITVYDENDKLLLEKHVTLPEWRTQGVVVKEANETHYTTFTPFNSEPVKCYFDERFDHG